jgi:alkylation response protein AidB-like acyl-CoA dehydrogenase
MSRAVEPAIRPALALDAEATTDLLVERVAALRPLFRARAREAESRGRLTDDVLEALERTEVFRALTPKRWGGLGLGLRCLCEVARVAANADASTAWVTCFLMEHGWMACRLPLAAQQKLFAGGGGSIKAAAPLAPGGSAARAPGGFRASGKWRYASGIAHADWVFVSCHVEEAGARVPWMFLVPVASVAVHDDWHVSGMRATSSASVSATDLFVPEEMAIELERFFSADGHPGAVHEESIYRYPILPGLLVMLTAVALGSAEGALELARAKLHETAPWGIRRIDRAQSRARWAAAHQHVRCARLLHRDMLARVVEKGEAGKAMSVEEDGQLALDVATTTHLCKDAVAGLLDGCGSSAFQLDDPLQRHQRDLAVIASHLGNDWDVVTERGARLVLGLPPLPTDTFPPRPAPAPRGEAGRSSSG